MCTCHVQWQVPTSRKRLSHHHHDTNEDADADADADARGSSGGVAVKPPDAIPTGICGVGSICKFIVKTQFDWTNKPSHQEQKNYHDDGIS